MSIPLCYACCICVRVSVYIQDSAKHSCVVETFCSRLPPRDTCCGFFFFLFTLSPRGQSFHSSSFQGGRSFMSETSSHNTVPIRMQSWLWRSAVVGMKKLLGTLHHYSLWLCLCLYCEIQTACCRPTGICGVCMHKPADNTTLILSVVLPCN